MGTDEPADAKAAASPVSTNGVVANGGGSAKKRLLPMELRRRRRAAKLQITSEKNVATISAKDIIESIQGKHTPDETVSDDVTRTTSTTPQVNSGALPKAATITPPQPATSLEPITTDSAEHSAHKEAATPAEISLPTARSTTKRLQNLFSFSVLDRKRQKLQYRESLVDVPTYMKVDRVPLDVAPKSKAVLSMSFQFPFVRPRASSLAAAMTSQPSYTPEVQWLQALQYYAHPASALPSSLNATNERQLEESEFYIHRFRVWQDSFRQAYFGFRRLSRHGTLYVRYPEFVACFYIDDGKAGQSDQVSSIVGLCQRFVTGHDEQDEAVKVRQQTKRLRAVISQSNARLRKELQRRGIEFHIPFNVRALQKSVTTFSMNKDDLSNHAIAASGADHSVHGPDSLLLFCGHHGVHGLYEFLLNRKPHSNQDVPEILASHPFTNAVIRSIAVRYMGKTNYVGRDVGDDASASGQISSIRSEVELSGFCLPSAMERLVACLEKSQQDETSSSPVVDVVVKAAMETAPMSERLNAVFLDDKNAGLRHGQEREAWKQQVEFAKRRLQSVKKVSGSAIEIETTTR